MLLDLFLEKDNWVDNAEKILSKVYDKAVKGFVSAKSVLDVHYLLRKEVGNNQSQQTVENFCAHCSIIEINEPKIIAVLQKHTNDFEDQIQLQCALSKKNIKYLITRNVKDFKTDAITVLSPDDFLKLYEKI